VKALPAFHVFSGVNNTGRITGVGKATCINIFIGAKDYIIEALRMPYDGTEVMEELQPNLARFVCAAYCPKGIKVRSIPELRWHLYHKKHGGEQQATTYT